ncbi:hypothetical protein SAMN05216466_1292 [Paraburkholderia phenazinium]|jgi:hypothetical protein|uniref:Uncharacterized protein n=1 Tax=Paraburkholderia phenazinium TaxID=60549 RepID=A0A1G8MAN0_9BURK|nr:hypothetical protein SAMN05216466_1292 [Paraburkholderia phenazinium]
MQIFFGDCAAPRQRGVQLRSAFATTTVITMSTTAGTANMQRAVAS